MGIIRMKMSKPEMKKYIVGILGYFFISDKQLITVTHQWEIFNDSGTEPNDHVNC